jgi:3-hydroxyacyl-[acyl-carrier-protein] dehydratase
MKNEKTAQQNPTQQNPTQQKPFWTAIDIARLLPHRFPFLLVDRVEYRQLSQQGSRVGNKILGIKNVTFNEPYFPGHFPHRPVMPGVLQIEAMAQVAALACVDENGPKMDVAIAGINEARFRRPVVPGDRLEITAEVLKDRGRMFVIKCVACVDGQVASEAEILAQMFPLEIH